MDVKTISGVIEMDEAETTEQFATALAHAASAAFACAEALGRVREGQIDV